MGSRAIFRSRFVVLLSQSMRNVSTATASAKPTEPPEDGGEREIKVYEGAMERRPKSRNRENKQTAGALLKNGMLGFRSVKELSQQLPDWLDLSLKHSISSSLLILSRAFYVFGRSEEVVDTVKVTSLPSEEIHKDVSNTDEEEQLKESTEPLTLWHICHYGTEEEKRQAVIDVFEIIDFRISQGITFGSLCPKEILIIGNQPIIPAGSNTGIEEEEYLQAFLVMVEEVYNFEPADPNAAIEQIDFLNHMKRCKNLEDIAFTLAHPKMQTTEQKMAFVPMSILQLKYLRRMGFPEIVKYKSEEKDYYEQTVVLNGQGLKWEEAYNAMFPDVVIDWKNLFANSTKPKALKTTFKNKRQKMVGPDGKRVKVEGPDGKMIEREVKGYGCTVSEELEFAYNLYKHLFEKVKEAGRIDCHRVIMEACPLCHIRLFSFLFFLHQNLPALGINLHLIYQRRVILKGECTDGFQEC